MALISTPLDFTATGTGAATRPLTQVVDEFVLASNFAGYDENGEYTGTDSAAAIMAADAVARSRNRELVLTGQPRIKSKLVLNAPTRWRMHGQHFKPGFTGGGSYIVKDGSLHDAAIEITPNAYGTILDGVALVGYPGNIGDGFYVTGNYIRLFNCAVQGMGDDGLRIGSRIAPVPPQPANFYNANVCRVENFAAAHNGRDGISIDDASLEPSLDANAIELRAPFCYANGRHGLYLNRTILGNVITCPAMEANSGWGIYCDAGAYHNVIVGGDVEANTAGQIHENIPFANRFIEVLKQGAQYHNMLQNGSFTPTVSGTTAAGSGTYVLRRGFYSVIGKAVQFMAELEWSAHTGTGYMVVTGLPLPPNAFDANIPNFVPVDLVAAGFTLAAGAQMYARYNHNINTIQILNSVGGLLTQKPMTTTGTLNMKGMYIPNI
ncbi:MAG: hypothetical protein QOD42_1722 [Sphingomonadales bacterium]|jgi:hypothetical protein|nr:hypothetical protein [Sphingomonadales bacterium]